MCYVVLGVYYSIRILFPPKFWPGFVDFLNFNKYNYCKSQKIIFDDEKAKFPESNSKTLFALSPHGIISFGCMCVVSIDVTPASLGYIMNTDAMLRYVKFMLFVNALCAFRSRPMRRASPASAGWWRTFSHTCHLWGLSTRGPICMGAARTTWWASCPKVRLPFQTPA